MRGERRRALLLCGEREDRRERAEQLVRVEGLAGGEHAAGAGADASRDNARGGLDEQGGTERVDVAPARDQATDGVLAAMGADIDEKGLRRSSARVGRRGRR